MSGSSIWVASAFTLMWQNLMEKRGSAAPAGGADEAKGAKLAAANRRR